MNKLIKKLADQHFVPDHRDENGRWEEYPHYEFEPEELKEFVQAIVLECAYMVNDYQRTTGYTDFAKMLCDKFDIEFREEDFYGVE